MAGAVASGFLVTLLGLFYSWLPGSLGLCVAAVFATFFFVILVKIVNFILGFVFSFLNLIKP